MNTISQFGIFILVLTCMQTGVVLAETDCPVKDTARGVVVKIEEEIEDFKRKSKKVSDKLFKSKTTYLEHKKIIEEL